jgi:ABC-type uncharacterized transport system substrate-binding protein
MRVATSSSTRRLGGTAAWPLVARGQEGDRVRRIGWLMVGDENDPIYKPFLSAFTQALAGLGWVDSRNMRMDLGWAGGDTNRLRALAREQVGLQPDIIVTGTTVATVALQRETRIPNFLTTKHRAPLIMAAARNNVPAIYALPEFVKDGGLLSYGFDSVDGFRRTATYVDRILRGASPADLPVQLPVKFEMAVNLKTAKALGLTVPQSILLTADEVIE